MGRVAKPSLSSRAVLMGSRLASDLLHADRLRGSQHGSSWMQWVSIMVIGLKMKLDECIVL